MTLLVFNINGKTTRGEGGGGRLKSLINNLRDLFGMLFGLIAFEALRNNIICLASISPVRLRKKEFILIGGAQNHENYFLGI